METINSRRFRLNRYSLVFDRLSSEKLFLREHLRKSLFQCRIALVLGFSMYIIFAILDFATFGQSATLIIFVRLILVPLICILSFAFTFLKPRWLELNIITMIFFAQLGHLVLFIYAGASNQYFYGTTANTMLFMYVFSRLRFHQAFWLGFLVFLSYQLSAWLIKPQSMPDLLMGSFILLSLSAISMLSAYSMERNNRQDFITSRELARERSKSDRLLLNILPLEVARELKVRGVSKPVRFESVSVMFADFVNFSSKTQGCPAGVLVASLDRYFSYFDTVASRYGLEKIKTIGDAYMVASGLPIPRPSHAVDCILAAMDFIDFVVRSRGSDNKDLLDFDIRIGVHLGPVIAGVLGKTKFTYDIFGTTVNLAARMEASSDTNKINISKDVKDLVDNFFVCEERGSIQLKHGQVAEMYWVKGIKPELALDEEGTMPGPGFVRLYEKL